MDEITFGSWSIQSKEWSAFKHNHSVSSDFTGAATVKAIVGISWNRGVEPFMLFTDRLDSDQVCHWLDQ